MQDFAVLGNILFPKPKLLLLNQILATALLNSQPIQCVIDTCEPHIVIFTKCRILVYKIDLYGQVTCRANFYYTQGRKKKKK